MNRQDKTQTHHLTDLQYLCSYMGLHQVALAQVSHSPHHAEFPVPHGHHGHIREHQCLIALLGLGDLSHYRPNDESVDDAAHNALQHDSQHRQGAGLGNTPEAVSYRRLRLQREEERRHKTVHLLKAAFLRLCHRLRSAGILYGFQRSQRGGNR